LGHRVYGGFAKVVGPRYFKDVYNGDQRIEIRTPEIKIPFAPNIPGATIRSTQHPGDPQPSERRDRESSYAGAHRRVGAQRRSCRSAVGRPGSM